MILPLLLTMVACDGDKQRATARPEAALTLADQATHAYPAPSQATPKTIDCSSSSDVERIAENIKIIANDEAEVLCSYLRASVGSNPPASEFAQLLKAAAVLPISDAHIKDTPTNLGKALVDVVESRGLQNNPSRAVETFETVFKIAEGTAGDVTPRDINVFLRSSGPMAKTISDDGLMHVAAVLREEKKESGT